jgi:hypothetical protein
MKSLMSPYTRKKTTIQKSAITAIATTRFTN